MATIKAVVLDIEGTTTPISFVAETLFPYISRELEKYIQITWKEENTQKDVQLLKELAEQDKANGVKDVVEITGNSSPLFPHKILTLEKGEECQCKYGRGVGIFKNVLSHTTNKYASYTKYMVRNSITRIFLMLVLRKRPKHERESVEERLPKRKKANKHL